jgi:hypothetical protein
MRLYNTLSRQLEELPAPPGPVRMYFCGPTVYQRAHIGNARPFVLGMWLRAWLRHRGYDATFVHNITDVNDKIYDAAPGASAELAERATQWYLEDTGDLGLGMPDVLPKATDAIPSIVSFIEKLVAAGNAYESDGDVYFSVAPEIAMVRVMVIGGTTALRIRSFSIYAVDNEQVTCWTGYEEIVRGAGIAIAPPPKGTYSAGKMVYNPAPKQGAPLGWVCVAGGTPGTWRPMGSVL